MRRASLTRIALILIAPAVVMAGVLALGERALAQAPRSGATELAGLATASGTVTAPQPFKGAQVYFRNVDKRMLYMVYTAGGKYQAMHLFPGRYELTVKAGDLVSAVRTLELKTGRNELGAVALRPADPNAGDGVVSVPFDELYPAGPARDLAVATCVGCHGVNFLPSRQWTAPQWDAAIGRMTAQGNTDYAAEERQMLVTWLAANFGPGSPRRRAKLDPLPVDEAKLAKAMYIEYYLPPHPPGYGGKRTGQDPHFDQQGNVWVTDRGTPPHFAKLDPRRGAWVGDWKNPGIGFSHGLTIDADGVVWLPESDDGNHLNAFDSKTEKFIGRYNYNPTGLKGYDGRPARGHTPVLDSKGNVWVSMIIGDRLIKWDRQTKQTTLYTPDSSPSMPYGISVDSQDNIWTVLSAGRPRVAKFDPRTEKWTEYPTLTKTGRIRRLGVDSKDIVWFGIHTSGRIGRLDPKTGDLVEIKVPHQYSQPYDIQADADNNMWFGDGGQGGALIKYEPRGRDTGAFTYYPAPQDTDMPKIEIARDGAIWYCPRSAAEPGVGVLYPDMTRITTLGAYYR